MPMECHDSDRGPCRGEVNEYRSRSGCTVSQRCDKHQDEYNERMDALHEDINSRYPGYDNPNSPPPQWFDPSYAGESWDGE
jgi:hypothetical protein